MLWFLFPFCLTLLFHLLSCFFCFVLFLTFIKWLKKFHPILWPSALNTYTLIHMDTLGIGQLFLPKELYPRTCCLLICVHLFGYPVGLLHHCRLGYPFIVILEIIVNSLYISSFQFVSLWSWFTPSWFLFEIYTTFSGFLEEWASLRI